MTVECAADRLRQLFRELGFDSLNPDIVIAWIAFQRFAIEPVEVQTTDFWFEAGDGDSKNDYPAYFDFVRMFTHYPEDDDEDGAAWSEQITAHFSAPSDLRLGLRGSVHAQNVTDLTSWFRDVEKSTSFILGKNYKGWAFEVRVDTC